MQSKRHKQIKKAIHNMIIKSEYTIYFNIKDTEHRVEQVKILYNNIKTKNTMV